MRFFKIFPKCLAPKSQQYCFIRKQHAERLENPEIVTGREKWKSVVGLEIHAQLATNSKLFSSAENVYAAPVNSRVSLFDAAIPGTLPALNKKCVELAVLASLALKCEINPVSFFDRKHYFYSDLPAGYQITQQRVPIAINGSVDYMVNPDKPYHKSSKIKQIQLEQDSGKSLHYEGKKISFIDLNRANIGLIEIIFEPDWSDAEEAAALVKEISMILKRAGACSCKMEEGALRVDANISVHKEGTLFGTRTEVKNIGSIRNVANAVNYEISRQLKIIKSGGKVINETLGWDAIKNQTVVMRDKEETQDYRFMPEPNLPPLRLIVDEKSYNYHKNVQSLDCILDVRYLIEKVPKTPQDDRNFLVEKYEILDVHAINLVNNNAAHVWFLEAMKDENRNPKKVYAVLHIALLSALKKIDMSLDESSLDMSLLGQISDRYQNGDINLKSCVTIFEEYLSGSKLSVDEIIREKDLHLIKDKEVLHRICSEVLDKDPKSVRKYLRGKTNLIENFTRRAVKIAEGKADTKTLTDTLKELLEKRRENESK